MKRILLTLGFLLSAFLFTFSVMSKAADDSLSNRLRGFVLLQVEENGEAWYVDPVEAKRIYMKNGNVAYNVMSDFGLGISNVDLAKIPVGFEDRFECVDNDGDGLCNKLEEGLETDLNNPDTDGDGYTDRQEIENIYNPLGEGKMIYDYQLANRLRGYIVLQVEKNGQAWYINPSDAKRYYMRDGNAAYQIMRYLSLGITNSDLEKIDISDYSVSNITPDPNPYCGDGICSSSETCATCQSDCGLCQQTAVCGNDIRESGEECDGEDGVPGGYSCTNDCKLQLIDALNSVCGNDIRESGEECDGEDGILEGYTCNNLCHLESTSNPDIPTPDPVCGNDIRESGEECDGEDGLVDGYTCNNSCQLEEIPTPDPVCGNDIRESGEECDGEDGLVDGYTCNNSCQLEEIFIPIYQSSIVNPYKNNIILAQSDVPAGTIYQWFVNGQVKETNTTPTIFLAHYDGTAEPTLGQGLLNQENVVFSNSNFGQGMSGKAFYPMNGNVDLTSGTLDIWLSLKQSLSSSVFDSNPYIIRYKNLSNYDAMYLLVHSSDKISFTLYDGARGWVNAFQGGTGEYDIPVNQNFMITATWSEAEQLAKFYLNGEQISRKEYSGDFPTLTIGNENLEIGNTNVVIDELRFLDRPLSTDEIRENYKRGAPFSKNDVLYDGQLSLGDSVKVVFDTDEGEISDQITIANSKINILSPDGFFVPHTSVVHLSFSTPSSMTCRYGTKPNLYENLPYSAGTGTSHNINLTVLDYIEPVPVAVKCIDSSGKADDYGFFRQYRILPEVKTTYPKISRLWWGNNPQESDVAFLSKFDMVNFSKGSLTYPAVIRQIRQANPNMVVLMYQTAIGVQQFSAPSHAALDDRVNDSMRIQSSEQPGTYCTNLYFPNNTTYNVYRGTGYTQTVAEHMEKDIFDRYNLFDGIWWDVTGPSFWFLYDYSGGDFVDWCDFNLDGQDDDLNDVNVRSQMMNLWAEGIHDEMQYTRARIGQDVLTVGNGHSPDASDYNGKLWEEIFNYNTFDQYFNTDSINGFFYWQDNSLEPRLNDNLFANNYSVGSASFYKFHRYGMTSSVIAGIYYNPQQLDQNQNTWWFDEYWVDPVTAEPTNNRSIGSGYLGEPIGPAYVNADSIWRRDFENGIVLVNGTASAKEVDLAGQFREIDGGQAPTINSGRTIEIINLDGYDGRILLRSLCSDNPYEDSRCIE